jgi:hypothetical protein
MDQIMMDKRLPGEAFGNNSQINTWNRIAMAFRAEPGAYQSAAHIAA